MKEMKIWWEFTRKELQNMWWHYAIELLTTTWNQFLLIKKIKFSNNTLKLTCAQKECLNVSHMLTKRLLSLNWMNSCISSHWNQMSLGKLLKPILSTFLLLALLIHLEIILLTLSNWLSLDELFKIQLKLINK